MNPHHPPDGPQNAAEATTAPDPIGDQGPVSGGAQRSTQGRRFIAGMVAACLLLTACSDPPKSGVVVSTEYDAAHYDTYLQCGGYTTVNNVTTCTVWLPAQSYVPDTWSLKLRNGGDEGWRDVPRPTYEACGMGSRYPECAGGSR